MALITGTPGDDLLLGTDFSDLITGLAGDDTIYATPGADTYDGGDGFDLVDYSVAQEGGVNVDLSISGRQDVLAGNFETLISIEGLRGSHLDDTLSGAAGPNTIYGGLGNDIISDPGGANYLRGDDGDDVISGGSGFDDINGNMGNDTAHGNGGDDWVVGGKDNDLLFGDAGSDIVWGNLGNDTLDGGDANDQVRGGQGDDSIAGGAGDDYISGDRGNDTVSGGAGADLFHSFDQAGIDRVIDFNVGEGDRVMLDPGTTYSVSQVGADTLIDMGPGAQMILVGVQMSSLPSGWIFEG